MTIRTVDHVNIATQDLTATRDFFVDVLGMAEGPRPPFDFRGYWLYADGRPIVHVQEAPAPVGPSTKSALNHVAFEIADYDAMIDRLETAGLTYVAKAVPGSDARQIFLFDPNGVRVELNYRP
ncbi:VOC family protein [Phenylobacterium deserti]|uniref:Glyoxalase n=1 Tax=Phenylobacterium deserti TaxID=1914756 RepID=A0A328AEF3_9CAUL|nr:VOC family protein [Phenylobacterium deserti]RAK52867.1 glyoxalase [Phenylobacterium deserti]